MKFLKRKSDVKIKQMILFKGTNCMLL